MFKFTLPKWAMLPIITPEGATCPMVHMGDGVFLSAMPPISLHTCQPLGTAPDKALVPVAWDSGVFGPDVEMAQSFFDAPGAAEALRIAADAGDVTAISTQATIKAHAREAGLVVPGA